MVQNRTTVYFIRHAESPFSPGQERERGLSVEGHAAAERVAQVMRGEIVDACFSSPYTRAVQTIQPLADRRGLAIHPEEDLRERMLAGADAEVSLEQFRAAKQRVFDEFNYSLPGGESSTMAQRRAVRVLERLLADYKGQSLVIGTHGDIMTLMLNAYDDRYGYDYWRSTSMPDIYKVTFSGLKLLEVCRLWSLEGERI